MPDYFADRASVIVGDAHLMLSKVCGPFDLIFQDGDKQLYNPLLDRLVALKVLPEQLVDDAQTLLLGRLNKANKAPPAAVAGKTYQGPVGYVID